MGKRTRKTRWRTLPIADEQSDSEESNSTSTQRLPKSYHQKSSSYLSKSTYSSQSSPRRRCQYDSTRSSSTTSETKITFNEDEYTRITTPRQDVLFKKGYLSKPKTYQTQTSTGNSTTSTGNSTGNGTPDYQSTDLEYDSQFVFPGGFVDQNGIYYVNSYEPYPLMVYNPTTYYPEFTNSKAKRCSTGSLTESMSPNNDEASSQDLSQSGGEQPNTFPDFPVYNMVYPGYYINGLCPPQEIVNGHCHTTSTTAADVRRMKKRRRRKTSKDRESTSEYSEESSEEENKAEESSTSTACTSPNSELSKTEEVEVKTEETSDKRLKKELKYDLKPDAEEFVPRAYRQPEFHHIPGVPGVPYVKLVNVPIHMLPNPAFIPVSYPMSYMPPFVHHHKNEEIESDERCPKIEEIEVAQERQIDLNQIVSKLEEAKKEREETKETEKPQVTTPNKPPYRNNNNKYKKQPYYQRTKEEKQDSYESSPRRSRTNYNYKASPKHRQNYSEMLKKETTAPTLTQSSIKTEESPKKESPTHSQKSNQWISVSSKKKRKNKAIEEIEDFPEETIEITEEEEVKEQDQFETYDVNDLVDVVPPSKIEEEETIVIQLEEIDNQIPDEETVEVVNIVEAKNEEEEEEVKITKKKSKKGTQKPLTKRVIITDVDLSQTESKVEETKKKEEEKIAEVAKKEETAVKKGKKKKKKTPKVAVEDVDVTNRNEDSYDFLPSIEEDKTNVDVYQELDKMIQKGMYNNLETKMKSMNVEKSEDFFKSVIGSIGSNKEEKTAFNKAPDFTRILQSTRKLYTNPVSLDHHSSHKKPPSKPSSSSSASDGSLSDTASGFFLDNPQVESMLTTPKSTEHTAKIEDNSSIHPITDAVRTWIKETREKTPEVEIFKDFEEVVLFSKEEDFWEDDLVLCCEDKKQSSEEEIEDPSKIEETSSIEEVPVYESNYGKNEDYLKIKEEIHRSLKHGGLPYRAICCELM
ncbi:unnamed protein product [Brassicogethes aeneus]|uniref:Uncharacterized protein n=1 Tax=Brassicogethes aeneus TaxID=1431903 RepID=A0A9P0FBI2_BRAAE|nr:unnamed protein product [Brassicogethes aeneus]